MSGDGDVLVISYPKDNQEIPEKDLVIERDSISSKSYTTSSSINETMSDDSSSNLENAVLAQNDTFLTTTTNILGNYDELTQLQSELWNLSQQEYYNEKKGLPKHMIKQIKKMKIGKVHKACSICHSDFVKDEIIMKLPCSHIFHYKCLKTWLKISIYCPLCRMNLKENFENAQLGKNSVDNKKENVLK